MDGTAPSKLPPGPKGHWFWGMLPERKRDPLGLLMRSLAEYGDLVHMRMGPAHLFQANRPDHVKHVLVDHPHKYGRGKPVKRAMKFFGEGLLLAEGDFWKRQRRLAQPAFHRERLASLVGQMVEATDAMLARWEALPDGTVIDIAAEMMRLTLGIVGRTLFSTDISGEADVMGQALTVVLHETNRRMMSFNPYPDLLPTRHNREFNRATAVLDQVILEIIAQRRKASSPGNDLLAMLMETRDADTGESMTDRQLRDEVMTMVLAGHETTANTMSWTWYLLDRNPQVLPALDAELEAQLGDRALRAEDLPKLGYANRIIQESMRLFPPAWAIGRQAKEPDEIDGYRIPKNAFVLVAPYAIHRNPALWNDPEKFDPDRFLPEPSAQRPRYAYIPFGAGQRMCIGNNFAMMEAELILAMVARRFTLTLAPGEKAEPEPLVTLRPKNGLRMVLRRRPPLARRVEPGARGAAIPHAGATA